MKNLIWLVVIVSFFGCEEWDLEKSFYPSVTSIKIIDIETAQVSGEYQTGENEFNITDHGHCWSFSNSEPTLNDLHSSLGSWNTNNSFSSTLTNLYKDEVYYVRAYIIRDGVPVYGKVNSFSIRDHEIEMLEATVNSNYSLTIKGEVTSLYELDEIGLCYSSTNNAPDLNDSVIVSNVTTEGSVHITVENLELGKTYYFSMYGIKNGFLRYSNISSYSINNIWRPVANFLGDFRFDAISFSIGNSGYVGTGVNASNILLKDFWEYNALNKTWTQRADIVGPARYKAVGFSIGDYGYVGTGWDGFSYLNDFWQYNPSNNTWTQKADFLGGNRCGAVGFAVENNGYLGTGYDGFFYQNDFYKYTPTSNTWEQINSVGLPRAHAVGFCIGNKGYMGTGDYGSSGYYSDFWEYTPTSNQWIQRPNVPGGARTFAIGFSLGDKGYIGTGQGASCQDDLWAYEPQENDWIRKTSFVGEARHLAIGFSIGDRGFVGTGFCDNIVYRDFYEYIPD